MLRLPNRGLSGCRWPVGNILLGDDTHRLLDRDMHDPICLIDPANVIEPLHLFGVELFHIRPRIGLLPWSGIFCQWAAEVPIGQ